VSHHTKRVGSTDLLENCTKKQTSPGAQKKKNVVALVPKTKGTPRKAGGIKRAPKQEQGGRNNVKIERTWERRGGGGIRTRKGKKTRGKRTNRINVGAPDKSLGPNANKKSEGRRTKNIE